MVQKSIRHLWFSAMVSIGHPGWAKRSNPEVREFLVAGFRQGLSRPERLSADFVEGIVNPYVTDVGKVSLIRNASGLNTSHTMMLVQRHHEIKAKTLIVWGEEVTVVKVNVDDSPESSDSCPNAEHSMASSCRKLRS